ncbi:MAG: helix-turn-helix transcriptional regulator [Muribaculaceae bacterium]|jgi:Predicted transcriptional regulators|nr:helix-turn-helix transcriptional regulator [Muribaculaceae bacterium]
MKNRIKVARAEMNITQGELAEKIGVTRQAVNSIELGKYVPSTLLALKMAQYFGKTVEELFILEDDEQIVMGH